MNAAATTRPRGASRAVAHAAAANSTSSPGNGTPTDWMRSAAPALGIVIASTNRGQSKVVHILDDPMPEFGDHEAGDDPVQILRHSTAHLLAAAVTELYPDTNEPLRPR